MAAVQRGLALPGSVIRRGRIGHTNGSARARIPGVRPRRHAEAGAVGEAFQDRPCHRRVGSTTPTP